MVIYCGREGGGNFKFPWNNGILISLTYGRYYGEVEFWSNNFTL
jgi:hypothetical protein